MKGFLSWGMRLFRTLGPVKARVDPRISDSNALRRHQISNGTSKIVRAQSLRPVVGGIARSRLFQLCWELVLEQSQLRPAAADPEACQCDGSGDAGEDFGLLSTLCPCRESIFLPCQIRFQATCAIRPLGRIPEWWLRFFNKMLSFLDTHGPYLILSF